MSREIPEISVVIPVYNEEVHIIQSLLSIEKKLKSITSSYEFIIVDDGSRDTTWDQLTNHGTSISHLTALRLSRNFGKELALCAGLEHACGRAVIIMDSDLQHPPSLLESMVRLWREEGKEIVECVKTDRGNESLDKTFYSTIFYSILNHLSGFDLKGASDFKLLDQKVVQAWRGMPERNTFFRGMTAWLGYNRAQIPFEVADRVGGKSQWHFLSLLKLAVNAVVAFSSIPLRFVSMFGLLFLIGAIVLGVQTIYQKFIGDAVTGFTTVILLLLFIGSVIMISLGIIGEYIASIYKEVKGRPRYLVSQKIDSELMESSNNNAYAIRESAGEMKYGVS
ncbi:glycosyltransferase family 2 protein [Paenibacillus radicis (ex Xue et al. 2023)]|uniref:Glycosyltransferase family 2 protein n=1 Tax=Paenibacillus radicis (ex Xue et al. 2023) TaxID=2972489 RepID=A0ABT1YHW9_9BACL|nr:glycosyltransferase family 2 protein [Paenibacillus radicis (ex Xue et al. 2023)]MCR8632577.1 glycosyltransferase family 2 protein [Paenibacillus radicis (ex Xue et al. 2023)]